MEEEDASLAEALRLLARAPEPLEVPESLGPYQVGPRLGRGASGWVYRGHDPRLDRPVALKVMRRLDHATGPALPEARLSAAVVHPGVAQVYDVGRTEHLSWVAMELIEGSTLAEVAPRLSAEERSACARQLVQALAAAHRAGVIHGDLKPSNVMVTREGAPKIVDFGLGLRASDGATHAATDLKALGGILERLGLNAVPPWPEVISACARGQSDRGAVPDAVALAEVLVNHEAQRSQRRGWVRATAIALTFLGLGGLWLLRDEPHSASEGISRVRLGVSEGRSEAAAVAWSDAEGHWLRAVPEGIEENGPQGRRLIASATTGVILGVVGSRGGAITWLVEREGTTELEQVEPGAARRRYRYPELVRLRASADGRRVITSTQRAVLSVEGPGLRAITVLDEPEQLGDLAVSPDGSTIAYIAVIPTALPDAELRVVHADGRTQSWRADRYGLEGGRTALAFADDDRLIWARADDQGRVQLQTAALDVPEAITELGTLPSTGLDRLDARRTRLLLVTSTLQSDLQLGRVEDERFIPTWRTQTPANERTSHLDDQQLYALTDAQGEWTATLGPVEGGAGPTPLERDGVPRTWPEPDPSGGWYTFRLEIQGDRVTPILEHRPDGKILERFPAVSGGVTPPPPRHLRVRCPELGPCWLFERTDQALGVRHLDGTERREFPSVADSTLGVGLSPDGLRAVVPAGAAVQCLDLTGGESELWPVDPRCLIHGATFLDATRVVAAAQCGPEPRLYLFRPNQAPQPIHRGALGEIWTGPEGAKSGRLAYVVKSAVAEVWAWDLGRSIDR